MARWQHGYANSGPERIYWERGGDGVPLVICHGAGSCHLSLYQQMAGLSGDRTQVVLWDQRGYGNSTFTSGEWGIGLSVSDMDAVLQALDLHRTPIHVVGQAMGALVAARWAVSHPERVLSLALWDGPFAAGNDGADLVWQMKPNDAGVQSTLVDRKVGWTRSVGAEFARRNPMGTFLYQTIQEIGNARPDYALVFAAAQAEPVPLAPLKRLAKPILIGRGEHDHVVDEAAYEDLAARLPGARLVTIPGAGHSPYFEVPEAWNQAMREHIART